MKVRHTTQRRLLRPLSLKRLQVLTLKPDDILVVQAHGRISLDQRIRLRAYVQAHLPGHECLVLDESTQLAALRPGVAKLVPTA